MSSSREFQPRFKPSVLRTLFGLGFAAVMFVGAVLVGGLAASSSQVSFLIEHGTMRVDSGSPFDGVRAFSLDQVTQVTIVDLHGGRRVKGTAAPGLCTGRWSYPDLGTVWLASDCKPHALMVRVTGEELPLVLAPPDPEALRDAMTGRVDAFVALPKGEHNTLLLHVLPGGSAALMVLTGIFVAILCISGPRRMRYRVTDGRLEVRTMFSSKSWPATELTARRHVPKVTLRMAGSALPGYYTGFFRVDGATTRVYATDLGDGVIIEGPSRILLTPADPDGFLAALRDAGAQA